MHRLLAVWGRRAAVVAVTIGCSLAVAQPLPPVHGLIVQWKNAPSHQLVRVLGMRSAESARLQRTLRAAGMGAVRLRAVGQAARLLDFGHRLSAGEAERLAERLRALPEVEWVVPNERERRLQVVTPNDSHFAPGSLDWPMGQWWLRPVSGSSNNDLADRLRGVPGIQSAWGMQTGSATAVVAVLDSGITSHNELNGHTVPGYDFVSEVAYANDGDGRDNDPTDPGDWVDNSDLANPALPDCSETQNSSWHGTVIAGIVAAASNNAAGVAGINWNGRVLPVRVAGKCGATVADIVDGMRWAAGLPVERENNEAPVPNNDNPARIINISFGGSGGCNELYQRTINELAAVDAVVVAAAGNEHGALTRPASCSGVIGVAALNRDGFKASYSNFGSQVVIATLGGDPPSGGAWDHLLADSGLLTINNAGSTFPVPGDSYGVVAGTSFSAPIVSGVISLMLSTTSTLTRTQIIQGLRVSARPHVTSNATSPQIGVCSNANPGRCICTTTTCGAGILDAQQALAYAANPTAYVAPNWPAVVVDDSTEVAAAVALGPDRPANPTASTGSSGGGGALSELWLLGLALGVLGAARASGFGAGRKRLVQQRLGAQAGQAGLQGGVGPLDAQAVRDDGR